MSFHICAFIFSCFCLIHKFFAADRLSDFNILVGDTFSESSFDSSGYSTCASVQGALGAGETKEINCNQAVTGRYVVAQLTGSNYLTICEFEVYGSASGEIIV